MKTQHIIALILTACISTSVNAAKPGGGDPPEPPAPQDVNVINDATNPVPVTVQGGISVSSEPQFVGFSSDSVQGDVGLAGMHGACAATYGAGARMCLGMEVIKTPGLQPNLTVPSGWIHPTKNNRITGDISQTSASCYNWTSADSTYRGHVLSGERMQVHEYYVVTYPGGVLTLTAAYCNQLRPVACCQ